MFLQRGKTTLQSNCLRECRADKKPIPRHRSIIFPPSADIDDAKLTNSRVINSSFHHNKTGCQMTFEDDYSAYWVYFVNFLGTLAVLPGNIVSALLMDKIGRLSMLGTMVTLSWSSRTCSDSLSSL